MTILRNSFLSKFLFRLSTNDPRVDGVPFFDSFTDTARTLAQVIINEIAVEASRKTIKQVDERDDTTFLAQGSKSLKGTSLDILYIFS
jgi:hypothetical protein